VSDEASFGTRALYFAGGVVLAGVAALAIHFATRPDEHAAEEVRAEHAAEVREHAEPVREALAAAAASTEPYDVEASMRVMRELDLAVRRVSSVREYFDLLRRQDFRRVSPRLLEARKRILDVLVKYYGALEKREHDEELWQVFGRWSDELGRVLQATDVDASTPFGGLSLRPSDPARQKMLADERARREAQREANFAELLRFEEELLLALDAAVPVFRELEDEWRRLCAIRDRAYLQTHELDYEAAAVSAQAALQMAPFDEEAMLLLALATIEGSDGEANPEREHAAGELLEKVLHDDPDCAPALLLRGVWNAKTGRLAEARTDLELAMTRYPEQAERLRDILDPYRSREYLQRTRQGGRITGLYRSMMLGASWFSPELQTARLEMQQGDAKRALERVSDHFARRRAQGQWDLILYDLAFCEDLLGERYRDFFPEKSYLDLEIDRSTFGDGVSVVVSNRSDVTLHNAALVLAVRFTDMVVGEYAAFTVGATQPVVAALSRTEFGKLELVYEGLGARKTADDVVPPTRAVLVTDEAVFWIDTIEFKSERATRRTPLGAEPAPAPSLPERWKSVLAKLGADTIALKRIENLISADDLAIELPREVVWLAPLFRLEIGGEVFDESSGRGVRHRIEGGKVRLQFEKVGKALDGAPEELRLVARSVLGEIAIVLARNPAGNYVFSRIEGP
jgi:tetratricopeptide (TPR) repeat protein